MGRESCRIAIQSYRAWIGRARRNAVPAWRRLGKGLPVQRDLDRDPLPWHVTEGAGIKLENQAFIYEHGRACQMKLVLPDLLRAWR